MINRKVDLPYVVDPWPVESEEFTQIYEFYEKLKEGKLATTSCPKCEQAHWPPKIFCPICLSKDLKWVEIEEGEIYSYTHFLRGTPPHIQGPAIMAIVKTDHGFRMGSRIIDAEIEEMEIGMKVEPTKIEVDEDRVIHAFTPKK